MSMTPGSQRVVKPGQNDRRLAAGDGSRGGGARKSPTGRRFERGLLLQLASARAHLVVAAFGRRVAGIKPGDELGGGGALAQTGSGATVHERASWWALSAPGSTVSSVTRSNASTSDCGCGGDMDGGRKLTAPAIGVARASKIARGERGIEEELTVDSQRSPACSGKHRR